MTCIHLIRHARAQEPGDLRLPGGDPDLLAEGVAQARAVAARVAALGVSAVWSSDAARARQTAALIAAEAGVPLAVRAGLREIDLGAWAGRTYEDIVDSDPDAARWFADPAAGSPPGGEEIADAADRVLSVLEELGAGGSDVAVVGHAGSLRLAMARVLGMPLARYWRLRLDLAGLSTVAWTDGEPTVVRLNDTCHLQG